MTGKNRRPCPVTTLNRNMRSLRRSRRVVQLDVRVVCVMFRCLWVGNCHLRSGGQLDGLVSRFSVCSNCDAVIFDIDEVLVVIEK